MPDRPLARLDEIRGLLAQLPGPDLDAGSAAATRARREAGPAGSLGRLGELTVWLATWQGRDPPRFDHPRTAIFAANHGIAGRPGLGVARDATARRMGDVANGDAAVTRLCGALDADLRLYEMNLDTATGDIVEGPAMDEAECAGAIAYGMMAVEPGIDALAVGDIGAGNKTVAAALCVALFGGDVTGYTGGENSAEDALAAAAVARHAAAAGDPFDVLCRLGGLEFAAIAGAVLAARMGRVPVVLDGFATCAAAAVLHAIDPRALDHCVAGHAAAEPGHRLLLERLGKPPLLDFGLAPGEATGATLALSLLKAATA